MATAMARTRAQTIVTTTASAYDGRNNGTRLQQLISAQTTVLIMATIAVPTYDKNK